MNPLSDQDWNDLQAIIVRGYGNLPSACYLLLNITDVVAAKKYLTEQLNQLAVASQKPETLAMNIALTAEGFQALKTPENIIQGFADEFRAGMTTPHRRRILGDEGDQAPEQWQWGGQQSVHLLVMLYAVDDQQLQQAVDAITQVLPASGLQLLQKLDSESLPDRKEHFGFQDGIAQPYIAEFDSHAKSNATGVALGEFVLGYENAYGYYTQRPKVDAKLDQHNCLPADAEGSALKDLGKNGTYLVFRQLQQDVPGFWSWLRQSAEKVDIDPIKLASKMVGRWPSGAPLVKAPDEDNPQMTDMDAFAYHQDDAQGHRCPLGAHIRRTNPRDSLPPQPGSEKSLAFSDRHRLLRRGRAYGAPFDTSMSPNVFLKKLAEGKADDQERGLHVICLNANITRQFEFVQYTWADNPNFNGLYQDPDPIIGTRGRVAQRVPGATDDFTIQACPLRQKVSGLPAFVRTRGGAYFFLPSKSALQFLLTDFS
jgi:Dyp-type peroxidase family